MKRKCLVIGAWLLTAAAAAQDVRVPPDAVNTPAAVPASASPPGWRPAGAPPVMPVAPLIADVPAFHQARLALADVPKPTGPRRSLFNGHDLSGFEPWLGYSDPALTYTFPQQSPLGAQGLGDVFKVARVDGHAAIFITGRLWGALLTPDLGNYHLRLSYKWGVQGRPGGTRNSGVLYHSYGALGEFMGTWMNCIEFDMVPNDTGMVVPIGDALRYTIEIGQKEPGYYRFMPGGKSVSLGFPTWVHAQQDGERAPGEWNQLDLYVAGNRAVHVVNGVPTAALSDLKLVDKSGAATPLTHGRIQLQSEGWGIYFRDITVEPIASTPRVVVVP